MFGDVWKWAGHLRSTNKNIGIAWQKVETSLFGLLADLAYWEQHGTYDLVDQTVLLHHRSVHIHPFENGNGRWSRMLANIWLKLHDHRVIEWPESTVGEQSTIRSEYLDAIRQADRGEYGPLRALHLRFTQLP
jgi:Fic-DOC domain mobile mystery protein B